MLSHFLNLGDGGQGGSANGNSDCSFKNVPTITCFEGFKNSSLGKTAHALETLLHPPNYLKKVELMQGHQNYQQCVLVLLQTD